MAFTRRVARRAICPAKAAYSPARRMAPWADRALQTRTIAGLAMARRELKLCDAWDGRTNDPVRTVIADLRRILVLFALVALGHAQEAVTGPAGDVPAPAVCAACGGSQKCARCRGLGETECQACKGKGKRRERCTRCGGDGRISETKTVRTLGKTRRVTATRSCPTCSGRGYRENNCTQCGADGKVVCVDCRGEKACPACKPKP